VNWLDLIKICFAGVALGVVVAKLITNKPNYLRRIFPRVWIPEVKHMRRQDWVDTAAIVLVFTVASFFLVGFISAEVASRWSMYSEEEYAFTQIEETSFVLLAIMVNILPIFEEWIFRGILLEEVAVRSHSKTLGIIISGIIFGIFHLSNPGTYLPSAIPLIVAGIMLGICYVLGGLKSSILCHCAYNSILLFL
jgi:membrane protease YdiL (CAAX protease family)